MQAKPHIVLVHGAWADGSSWSGVIPALQDAGHRVIAVQLAFTSLDDDVAITRRALDMLEGPTILAAHSIGGMVITNVGSDAPNLAGLVYVAAFAPDEGENVDELGRRFPPTPGPQHLVPDAGGFLWLDPEAFLEFFAPDVDPAWANVMKVVQHPITGQYLGVRSGPPAWRTLPSWYQISENDQIIHPDLERFMAQRIGATTISLPSSHVSLVSHPTQIAELILEAARDAVH